MSNKIKNFFIYISVITALTIVLLTAVELSSGLFLRLLPVFSSIYSHSSLNSYADCRVLSPAYTDKARANKIFKEYSLLKTRYTPYIIWRFNGLRGEYINTDKRGIRDTIPGYKSKISKKIFFFGGSTMWGVGVDDGNTIPSIVSRYLNKGGNPCFEVINFGRVGYVSTQELIQLILEIQNGNIPDIVIFYDGINDIYASAFSPGIASYHENYSQIKNRMEAGGLIKTAVYNSRFLELVEYVKNRFEKKADRPDANEAARVEGAINVYSANLKLAQGLSEKYGFKFIAFWQPIISDGGKKLTEYEEIEKVKIGAKLSRLYAKAYEDINKRRFDDIKFFNLSCIFRNENDDIFIDFAHLADKGNLMVAKKIIEQIEIIKNDPRGK
jgi:lysophospholipase L1-like esterase